MVFLVVVLVVVDFLLVVVAVVTMTIAVPLKAITVVVLSMIWYFIVLYTPYLSISIPLLTARAFQKRSRPQQLTLCRSLHAEALQATVSEGLAQCPCMYVAARAGFEPTTLRSKGID